MFRVLQKNAQVQSAQSCFNRMPTSEAIRIVYLWFGDAFGEKQDENETKLISRGAGKHKARMSMSNINLSQLLSRKYVAKQENADVLLHHYYYSRIFSVWKKEYRAYKSLKSRANGRLLSAVLTGWQRCSLKNKRRNQLVRQLKQKR